MTPSGPPGGSPKTATLPSPDVSVVIPTFHRERLVLEAIRSALDQPGLTVEVLVVDDSQDATARPHVLSLGDPRVRYLHREVPSRGHPALARNDGLDRARAPAVSFLDDDDRLARGGLTALHAALDTHPEAGVALGAVAPFGDDPAVLRAETAYFRDAAAVLRACRTRFDLAACMLYRAAPLVGSACLFRRPLALALGGYDASLPHLEDGDMVLRAARAEGFVFVDRPVVHYRTGRPSRIHGAAPASLLDAYRGMHAHYRDRHGALEIQALRALALTLGPRSRLPTSPLARPPTHAGQ